MPDTGAGNMCCFIKQLVSLIAMTARHHLIARVFMLILEEASHRMPPQKFLLCSVYARILDDSEGFFQPLHVEEYEH